MGLSSYNVNGSIVDKWAWNYMMREVSWGFIIANGQGVTGVGVSKYDTCVNEHQNDMCAN